MIPLGLTVKEQAEFHAQLMTSHQIDIQVNLLTMEEKNAGVLQPWLLGGQVHVDAEVGSNSNISRSCQITLLDPNHRAGIDSDSPGISAGLDRMISVSYGVWVVSLDRWVRVPAFRGPITKVTRDGDLLTIDALGKEHLLRSDAGWTKVYPAGKLRTWVIKDIAQRMGERSIVIPSWSARTSKAGVMIKLGRGSHPWTWMQEAARSMRAQLYYDGAGTLRLRRKPTRVSWWFKEHHLLSEPKITIDDTEVFNYVWVKGQAPEGKKTVVESRGAIPITHTNSVQRLGRHGAYRYLTDTIEDDQIRSVHDARVARDKRLHELEVTEFAAEFDCLPIPHFDPNDLAHMGWGAAPGNFRVNKFTLPLTAGDAMSVGYTRETRRTPYFRKVNVMRKRNRSREKSRGRKT